MKGVFEELNETQQGIITDYFNNFIRSTLNDILVLHISVDEQKKYPLLVQEVLQSGDSEPSPDDDNDDKTTNPDFSVPLLRPGQYFNLLNALYSHTMDKISFTNLVIEAYNPAECPNVSSEVLLLLTAHLIFMFDVCQGNIPSVNDNPENKLVLDVERLGSAPRDSVKHHIGQIIADNIRQWAAEPEKKEMITKSCPQNLSFVQRLELWKERDNTSKQQK